MANSSGPTDKLDSLTEQVGHLTEAITNLSLTVRDGFAELKTLVEKQFQTADKQADIAKSLADSVAVLIAKLNK